MQPTTTSVLVLSLLGVVPLSAQNRVDFSGRWTPVNPASASQVLTIVQDTTSLVAELTEGALTERARFTFAGTTEQDVPHANVGVTSTASWTGATLRASTTFKTKAEGTLLSVRDEVWSLDATGQLVIERTTRRPSGQTSTTTSVYKRK